MKKNFLQLTAALMALAMTGIFLAGCKPMNTDPQITEAATVPATTAVPTVAPTTEAPAETETVPATTEAPMEAPTEAPAETETVPATTEAPTEAAAETAATEATVTKPYYVRVNCQTNTVNVFTQDENHNYTVPYRVMVCSSGLEETPTPTGTYNLTGSRWEWLEMVGGVWGMYVTQITGNYLFHSVPYTEYGNHGSLQEGEFDKLGEDASHGCIRLQMCDAKWVYDNMESIQAVELYNSPDPGPMGKPMPMKIGDREYPGWDPTDMVPNNPWHTAPNP